jgi:nicotinate-nucleotide adenylyltransferase
VWLVPSFNHPLGKALEPFEDRIALCEALVGDAGPWLQVSRVEEEVGGQGRTIELLEWLLPRYPGTRFRWVIGSDIVQDLPRWKAWERIQSLVEVTVLNRAGFPAEGTFGPALPQVSSTEVRKKLEANEVPSDVVPQRVVSVARLRGLYGLR